VLENTNHREPTWQSRAFFLLAARFARIASRASGRRPGAFHFSMSASFNFGRLGGFAILRRHYGTGSENLQEKCRENAKTPGIPGVLRRGR